MSRISGPASGIGLICLFRRVKSLLLRTTIGAVVIAPKSVPVVSVAHFAVGWNSVPNTRNWVLHHSPQAMPTNWAVTEVNIFPVRYLIGWPPVTTNITSFPTHSMSLRLLGRGYRSPLGITALRGVIRTDACVCQASVHHQSIVNHHFHLPEERPPRATD